MSRARLRVWIQLVTIAAIAMVPSMAFAAKGFAMPPALPAKNYPAHDQHPTEAVSVAVDPYDLADKANIFSVHYSEIGFLPIFVVITNDGNQPVELSGMKAQMVTANRAKLSPAADEDISRRLTRPSANTNPLAGAHFYLTGVRDAKGNELMYFEVPLEKYLSAPAKSN